MAYSYIEYTAAGSSTFNIPFDYINQSEIEVFVDGTAATFTFTSANTVNVSPTPTNGATVRVERNTDLTNRAVDFASGSVLTEEDMDNSNIQVYHAAQEAIDKAEAALSLDADGKFDGEVNGTNRVIKNVANPTNAQDVATKDYLENTWLTPSDKTQLNALNTTNLNTVAGSVANVNTVASNISDVNTVASNNADVDTVAADITKVNTVAGSISNVNTVSGSITNVNTTAGSISNVNTVATNISDVTTVANDLNEPVSEIETVATDIANVNTVGTNISNVNAVAGNNTNITAVANNATNINAVNSNSSNINAVAGNQTNINAVNSNSTNINAVAGNATNINTVAGDTTEINALASITGNIGTVAGISSDVTAVANISTDIQDVQDKLTEVQTVADDLQEAVSEIETVAASITNVDSVATNISNVNAVAGNATNINAVNANSTNINAVNANSANINTVAGAETNINTVASNITDVNSFADTYSIGSTAPASPTAGDLWFDTSVGVNTMKVYNGTSWQNAGSSVNGTSARFKYTATSGQTTFSGSDANGNTLAYDSGYIDVFLNGIHLDPTDYTATNGTSIVLASGAALNDELYVVAFGTFTLSTHYTSAQVDSLLAGISSDALIDSGGTTRVQATTSGADVTGDMKLTRAGDTYYVPRASDGATTGRLYSELDNDITLSGEGSGVGYLRFKPSSGSGEAMRIDSSGNVGIGTGSPDADLHIEGASASLHIEHTTNGLADIVQLDLTGIVGGSGSGNERAILFGKAGSPERQAKIAYGQGNSNGQLPFLAFFTGDSADSLDERMRIDSTGKVGIGTTSPNERFHTASSSNTYLYAQTTSSANESGIRFGNTASSGTYIYKGANTDDLRVYMNGAERMRMDSQGRVTMPYQPAFSATSSGNNVSGTLVFTQASINNGGHYSPSTGRFTAPISGMYYFYVQTLANSGSFDISFYKNGTRLLGHSESNESIYKSVSNAQVIYMNANDYVDARVWAGSSYGADYSIFTGYLLG